ncbi:hypothetical protein ACTXT7_004974 [Hymenolepis weldensis]
MKALKTKGPKPQLEICMTLGFKTKIPQFTFLLLRLMTMMAIRDSTSANLYRNDVGGVPASHLFRVVRND